MGYNAIEIDGDVKLDLSQDTVTEETLPEGVTAHNADGDPIEGKMKFVKSINGKNGEVTLGAEDVGARPDTWTPSAEDVGARPNTWMPSYSDVNADKAGTAQSLVSGHNTNTGAHNDIRLELKALADRINAVLDSDDTTLDELSEIVTYIKSNKTLIDSITTSKVNVADIINNLTSNVTNKPLSAAQGVALKALIDALDTDKLDASTLTSAINTALAQAKASGEFDGADGKNGEDYVLTDADREEIAGIVAGDNLPDYWEEYLPSKIAAIKALQDEGGKDCFSFIVITDMHYKTNLGKRSPAVAKRILDKCDIRFVLALGDFQNREIFSTKEETDAEWGDIRAMLAPINENVLMQKGNHDGSWGLVNDTLYAYNFTPAELYNRVYALTYKNQNVVTDESGTAYYVDDTARKIRFIMLNTTCNLYEEEGGIAKYNNMTHARLTQVQFDFLTEKALATVPDDDWCVVLAGHHPLWEAELKDANILLGVLGAYKSKGEYSGEFAGTASGSTANYTNLLDENGDGFLWGYFSGTVETPFVEGAEGSKSGFFSNYIPIKTSKTDPNLLRALDKNKNLQMVRVYKDDKTPVTNLPNWIAVNATDFVYDDNGVVTWKAAYVNGYVATATVNELAYVRLYFRGESDFDLKDFPITVNEPIEETTSEGGGYDAVSVACDFSEAKGNLIGYFSGHNHNDMTQVLSGIRQVITRCDANEEHNKYNEDGSVNTNGPWYQRQQAIANGDKIQEQSFNVFTVNKEKKRIYATKIGAGEDFGGDDAPITY